MLTIVGEFVEFSGEKLFWLGHVPPTVRMRLQDVLEDTNDCHSEHGDMESRLNEAEDEASDLRTRLRDADNEVARLQAALEEMQTERDKLRDDIVFLRDVL